MEKINNNIDSVKSWNQKNIISQAQKAFVEQKLENDLTFFDSLNADEIFNNFKKFLNSKPKFRDLALNISWYSQDQKEILSEQIKDENLKSLFIRKKWLKDLEKIFVKEYDNLDLSKIIREISLLSFMDLKSLLKSEQKRMDFLKSKSILDEKNFLNSKKIDLKNILENIKIKKDIFEKLPQEQKEYLFYLFNNKKAVDLNSLEIILETIKDKESRSNLIKYFISNISLADLEKHNILPSNTKKIISKSIKDNLWVSLEKAEEIYEDLDKEDLFLSTEDLKNVDLSSFLDDSSFKKKIVDEYNSDLKNAWIDENNFSELNLDKNWKIHEAFISMIKYDPNIKQNLREQINLLQVWNIIELTSSQESWQKKWYYYIKKVDVWNSKDTKSMVLENITANNWMKKIWEWIDETHSYSNFYKLLEKVSSSDPENPFSMNFTNKANLKSSWVEEVIDSWDEIGNYEEFVKAIDSIDSEWKNAWLTEKWTVIYSKKDNFVFEITNINKALKTITIDQGGKYWKETISFAKFYDVLKNSDWDLTRNKKMNNFSDFALENPDFWNFKISGWKLYSKDKEEIKYLSWEGWKAIYINEIWENSISYSLWDIKEEKKWKKTIKNFDWKDWKAYNFNQLSQDIKKFWLIPNHKNEIKNDENDKLKRKGSFLKKFLSGLSISEILNSAEIIWDGIKKKLERWNRLKSLKFAQKFWFLFWKDFESSIKSSAEQEEKNLIEEIKWNLQALDSKPMIDQIKEILQNKDSEQYEVIAALFAVLKYWSLYPKDLSQYSWSFIWYKALWGTEEFKQQEMKKIENLKRASWKKEHINFTEEVLIQNWLKKLGSQAWWEKVRSKLWKDYAKELSSGVSSQLEDWKENAAKKITYDWRISEFIWNLSWREYATALWTIETIFWKTSNPVDAQAVPFILATSWYWKDFWEEHVKKVQWLVFTTPYVALNYWYSKEWHEKFKRLIYAIIEKSPKIENKSKMKSDYDKVLNSENVVQKSYSFWKEYWTVLADYMNFKDPMVALKKDETSEFKDYYETAKWVWWDWEYSPESKEIEIWVYNNNPVAIAWNSNVLWSLRWTATGWFNWDLWKNTFNMFMETLKSIKNGDGPVETKKELFKEVFMPFERYVAEIHGQFINKLSTVQHPIYAELVVNWLDLVKTQTKWPDYDAQIERIFYNFMNSYTLKSDSQKTVKNTKLSIEDILSSNI